ncbi:MAG: hypothetical protein LUQ07_00780 [Methanospirillum sp.]|nr:hypothetical protein [Methanospirillum sp.]
MTLVTTSRRSTPLIRSIAKDLAFAMECSYISRGKRGLRDIADEHEYFIVVEQHKGDICLVLYHEHAPVLCRIITECEPGIREQGLCRGIVTSDKVLAETLPPCCRVQYKPEKNLYVSFDGPQKRSMRLIISPGEIHAA